MDTVQYPSGSGLHYPTSGELIGLFAEFLRLKGFIRDIEAISSKTAERYFRGERIDPRNVEVILDALVAPLLPSRLFETDVFGDGFEATVWVRELLADFALRWDALASQMTGLFPVVSAEDSPLPFLRLAFLDFGLRWGAYQAVRASLGRGPVLKPAWLARDALRVMMDQYRPKELTLAELAREGMNVSMNTIDAWRAGTQIPTEENLDGLASVLATYSGYGKDEIKARLRLGVGVSAAWNRLAGLLSNEGHVTNLVLGFETAAERSLAFFKWLPLPVDESGRIAALRRVIEDGARTEAGAAACVHLASLCELTQEVEADFRALPGDWKDRINYWLQWLGTQAPAAKFVAERTGRPLAEVEQITRMATAMAMRMGGFDTPASSVAYVVALTGDESFQSANHFTQADRAWSMRDYERALAHLERAIELQPKDASYRRKMGVWLGMLVADGEVDHLNHALAELREAVRLEPRDQVAATEIGVVLSNAGLLDEAEKAFVDAEPASRLWHHFHQARGITLAWNKKFAEAEASLECALDLDPNAQHAGRYLAWVKMKLGKKREAQKLSREFERVSGQDPLKNWEADLARRPNAMLRWVRIGDGWEPSRLVL